MSSEQKDVSLQDLQKSIDLLASKVTRHDNKVDKWGVGNLLSNPLSMIVALLVYIWLDYTGVIGGDLKDLQKDVSDIKTTMVRMETTIVSQIQQDLLRLQGQIEIINANRFTEGDFKDFLTNRYATDISSITNRSEGAIVRTNERIDGLVKGLDTTRNRLDRLELARE